jgi:hypothetical protein
LLRESRRAARDPQQQNNVNMFAGHV